MPGQRLRMLPLLPRLSLLSPFLPDYFRRRHVDFTAAFFAAPAGYRDAFRC